MSLHTNHGHALLIGVDNYRAFDATGGSDLPGSINDLVAWYQVLVRRGFAPRNIRVLASPSPSALAGLAGIIPDALAATKENIEQEMDLLAERLADRERSVGFFTFSGHGDVDEDGAPVICPSDTRRHDQRLENVILVRKVIHKLGRNATLVMDCCHSGFPVDDTARTDGRALPPGGAVTLSLRRPPSSAILEDPHRVRPSEARVLSATSTTGVAFQAELGGRFQGVLTWALTTLLGQWTSAVEGGLPRVTLPCSAARERAEKLIAPLALHQIPALHGAHVNTEENAGRVPLINTGVAGEVSIVPDAPRVPIQFPPCLKVWLEIPGVVNPLDSGVVSAVSYPPPRGFSREREYWRLTPRFLDAVRSGATPLDFVVDRETAPPRWDNLIADPPLPLFSMDLVPEWRSSAAPSGLGYYLSDRSAAVMFDLTPPASPTDRWSGTITWYRVLPDGSDPRAPVFGARGARFERLDAAPGSLPRGHWQKVVLAPTPA